MQTGMTGGSGKWQTALQEEGEKKEEKHTENTLQKSRIWKK